MIKSSKQSKTDVRNKSKKNSKSIIIYNSSN